LIRAIAAQGRKANHTSDKNKPGYKVGDRIQISLNNRIMDAVIRAVIRETSGLRLQVDSGHEQTALIHEW
jgi:hypothetical protein